MALENADALPARAELRRDCKANDAGSDYGGVDVRSRVHALQFTEVHTAYFFGAIVTRTGTFVVMPDSSFLMNTNW